MIRKTPDKEKVLSRLAGLCARSEQCTFDIKTKLYRSGLSSSEREEILDYLIANRYIDDGRYARAFTNDKIRFSYWGRRKIRMALAGKRISSSLVSAAFDAIDEEEYKAKLTTALKRLAKNVDLDNYEERAKLYRRMLNRGYESNLISTAISRIRN